MLRSRHGCQAAATRCDGKPCSDHQRCSSGLRRAWLRGAAVRGRCCRRGRRGNAFAPLRPRAARPSRHRAAPAGAPEHRRRRARVGSRRGDPLLRARPVYSRARRSQPDSDVHTSPAGLADRGSLASPAPTAATEAHQGGTGCGRAEGGCGSRGSSSRPPGCAGQHGEHDWRRRVATYAGNPSFRAGRCCHRSGVAETPSAGRPHSPCQRSTTGTAAQLALEILTPSRAGRRPASLRRCRLGSPHRGQHRRPGRASRPRSVPGGGRRASPGLSHGPVSPRKASMMAYTSSGFSRVGTWPASSIVSSRTVGMAAA